MKTFILCLISACIIAKNVALAQNETNSTTSDFAIETEGVDILKLLMKVLFKEKWLEVPLDHFNLFDNTTWQMRYIVYDKHYQEGGPIFIEVGGEWTINGVGLLTGPVAELAQKHHGMLVETEHRYYGESLPFGTNFTTENLKYLVIEQAIEDLAYFIEYFKSTMPSLKNSKVIVHGCSYPGMLVTWLRLRFPHVVDIAYASSAPLGVGLDYPEFFEIVNDVYANVSSDCISTIKVGFNETNELLKTDEGRTRVRAAFKDWTCGDIEKMNSIEILSKIITVLNVMHDPSQYEDVACLVMAMDTDDSEAFQRLANFIVLKSKHIASCKTEEQTDEETRTSKYKMQL